jgi:YtoQ family protein
MRPVVVYLAGEIHSDWRARLREQVREMELPVEFVGPQEAHDRSDSAGEDIVGAQPTPRYRDVASAGVNTLRTRVLLRRADLVVAYFGDRYRQWNTAADAGAALAAGVPLLLVRAPDLTHALKEVEAMAAFTVETLEQAARALAYVFE